MRCFSHVIAQTPAQIADAQRLRWLVYGEQERMLSAEASEQNQQRLLIDASDDAATTVHVLVYSGDQAVGTVRLTLLGGANGALRPDARAHITPPFRVEGLGSEARLAVVERFCVLRSHRGTRVTAALYSGLTLESQRRKVSHWLALANTQTDCAQDAILAYRVATARGLSSSDVRVLPTLHPCPTVPCTRHIYSPAQRAEGACGDPTHLPLPRTLNLFARRMGGRYVGPPIYDTTFGVFALPLIAKPGSV